MPQDTDKKTEFTATATTYYTLNLGDGVEITNASRRTIEGLILWTGQLEGENASVWTLAPSGGEFNTLFGELFSKDKKKLDGLLVVAATGNVNRALGWTPGPSDDA